MADTYYYQFYGRAGSVLTITLTDSESASCQADVNMSCGQVEGRLFNQKPSSHPLAYVTPYVGYALGESPTTTVTVTLPASQVYQWDVYGNPDTNNLGQRFPISVNFTIAASIPVQWPPPTVVRPLALGASLAAWRHDIARVGCKVGKVVYVYSAAPRGRVIALSPPAGTEVPIGTVVNITVSAGPHRTHHHHGGAKGHQKRGRR